MKTPEQQAKEIVRYDMENTAPSMSYYERMEMVACPSGDWVRYEDHLQALRESSKLVPEGEEIARLREQVTTLARVEGELRKTIAFARQALLTARDAMKREAWQEGPTIGNAEHALGEMIDVIKHEITVEHAEYQLKWAAKKACDAIRERNAAVAILDELTRYAATLSPGPYQWGIYEEKDRDAFVLKNLSFGTGDTHAVLLPGHKDSDIGTDPMRPNHAVTMFITGNGPKSKDNALGLLRILEILSTRESALSSQGKAQ